MNWEYGPDLKEAVQRSVGISNGTHLINFGGGSRGSKYVQVFDGKEWTKLNKTMDETALVGTLIDRNSVDCNK